MTRLPPVICLGRLFERVFLEGGVAATAKLGHREHLQQVGHFRHYIDCLFPHLRKIKRKLLDNNLKLKSLPHPRLF